MNTITAARIGACSEGFEPLVSSHMDAAYNLAHWLMLDEYLARKVTQEALFLYRDRSDDSGARTWLLRIVRRAAYKALAAEQESPLQLTAPSEGSESELHERRGVTPIDRALAALPTELRECLVLRELEGLSYSEIARIIREPIGAVMLRLKCARHAILELGSA
jgi:RNA polymerase sigma-70 factor (ECF subfamily)